MGSVIANASPRLLTGVAIALALSCAPRAATTQQQYEPYGELLFGVDPFDGATPHELPCPTELTRGDLYAEASALWFEPAEGPATLVEFRQRMSSPLLTERDGNLLVLASHRHERRWELTRISLPDLAFEPLMTFDATVDLLGRIGEHVVLLSYGRPEPRVLTVDREGVERHAAPAPTFQSRPRFYGIGPRTLVARVNGESILAVEVGDDGGLSTTVTAAETRDLWLEETDLVVAWTDGSCVTVTDLMPESWSHGTQRQCPDRLPSESSDEPAGESALIVDGAPQPERVPVEVNACAVQTRIALTDRRDVESAPAGILYLGRQDHRDRSELSFLVMGNGMWARYEHRTRDPWAIALSRNHLQAFGRTSFDDWFRLVRLVVPVSLGVECQSRFLVVKAFGGNTYATWRQLVRFGTCD